MTTPPLVVAIGEVLWDLLPSGPQLGGAPANVACHAHSLGAQSVLISKIGDDVLGRDVLRTFADRGWSTKGIEILPGGATGHVDVQMLAGGEPQYTIRENVAWDHIQPTVAASWLVQQADAICFGSLAQRTEIGRSGIQSLLKAGRRNALRVFDVNIRQSYWTQEILRESLSLSNALKLNESELSAFRDACGLCGSTCEQLEQLAKVYSLRWIAFTRGAGGSLLYANRDWVEHPGFSVAVCDTVGAGDAFTAATILGWLRSDSADAMNRLANEVAAFVCTQPGATPALPEHFQMWKGPN